MNKINQITVKANATAILAALGILDLVDIILQKKIAEIVPTILEAML